jgi:hypothetical protein
MMRFNHTRIRNTKVVMQHSSLLEKTIDSLIGFLKNDLLREKIQLMILEPLLQYSMERLFPYLILLCAIVISMILLLISILLVLLLRKSTDGIHS